METRIAQPGPAAFYGTSKFVLPVMRAIRERGQDFYYIDNGYFRPSRHREKDYSGYYRITKNAEQHDGSGLADPARWNALGIELEPWRPRGEYVLVICQSKTYFEMRGLSHGGWLWQTLADIARLSDRPVIVRAKPTRHTKRRDIRFDLDKAWCVVTHTSNVAVDAVVKGIPVYVTGQCAASVMAGDDIDEPRLPDREQWAWNLAANQWTLDEVRTGWAL